MATKKKQRNIGVDLGGTKIFAGAMPEDGSRNCDAIEAHARRRVRKPSPTYRRTDRRGDPGDDHRHERAARDFTGVGIGSPGPLDREKGIVIVTPNLGWQNFPLRDEVAKRVGFPASLDNDANARRSANGGTARRRAGVTWSA